MLSCAQRRTVMKCPMVDLGLWAWYTARSSRFVPSVLAHLGFMFLAGISLSTCASTFEGLVLLYRGPPTTHHPRTGRLPQR